MMQENPNLNFRKDVRSVEEFKRDIAIHTNKEKQLISIWEFALNGKVKVLDNGMDNSGDLVLDAKNVNKKPDYKILFSGKEKFLEVKTSPVSHKATFKTDDLTKYIKIPNTSILLFVDAGKPTDTKFPKQSTKWTIINNINMKKIMEIGLYTERDFRFGYKPTYMVTIEQMHEMNLKFRNLY